MNIQPLQDRLIVKIVAETTISAGGILIPDAAVEKPARGIVLAVGTGKIKDNGDTELVGLNVGDQIIFGKQAGIEVKIDDTIVLFMREEDILGIFEE